jgi:predicted transcriptional regulator of viral defense system
MKRNIKEEITAILEERGLITPADLAQYGIRREYLSRLKRQGVLDSDVRGVYYLKNAAISEHSAVATACKRVPGCVVCLLSALRFHNIGTQNPSEVWVAVPKRSGTPKLSYPHLRVVRFSDKTLSSGVEEHSVMGVNIKVTSVAKTIADCLKFRNKIGLDVFLEALKESINEQRCSYDDIWHYAKVCRVSNIIKPYLEITV